VDCRYPITVPDDPTSSWLGAGPAGLGRAVYGASDGLPPAAMERIADRRQAGTSSRIGEELPRIPRAELRSRHAERAVLQDEVKFGARIIVSAESPGWNPAEVKQPGIRSRRGSVVARAVVLAMGARYRRLAFPGIESCEGNGVLYAATFQEALMCGTGPSSSGGGNSGAAAVFVARRFHGCYVVRRERDMNKTMSHISSTRSTAPR